MPKSPDLGEELYAFITNEGAVWTVADIAKKFGLRAPLVTHYVVTYCVEQNLPLPVFKLTSEKLKVKKVRRGSKSRDIRISQLSLEKANLGEEMRFKLLFEPRLQAIVLLPEDAMLNNLQEFSQACLQDTGNPPLKLAGNADGDAAESSTVKLKALRPPRAKKTKDASLNA